MLQHVLKYCELETLVTQKGSFKNVLLFYPKFVTYVEKKKKGFLCSFSPVFLSKQDILSYHKRSQQRLPPGLYLGYLKLCSSVDQIKVLVLQKLPNVLCHVKIRDNSNVSR